MFLARKPLLLSGGDDLAIHHQAGSRVMIKSRKAEDVHWLQQVVQIASSLSRSQQRADEQRLEQGIDERGEDRALGHDQQGYNENHDTDDWSHPQLLANAQERPQFFDKRVHI